MADTLAAAVSAAHNVLVLSTGSGAARDAVCESLAGDRTELLAVTLGRTGADWVAAHDVDSVHVVETGEATVEGSTVVESPADLTGLEIAVGEPVGRMDSSGAVCVDALTVLLEHVDPERAYQFVHALTTRTAERGVTAHFHVDPAAHEAADLARLATLFDVMVGIDVPLPAAPDESLTVEGSDVGVLRRPGIEEGNA